MSDHQKVMISLDNLSKKYTRSLKKSLKYAVCDIIKNTTGKSVESDLLRPDEFWALKDISINIYKGESVGLIGHNGAGKTTLLKLVNGLIKPTSGKITVRGSVHALIALGAGFNPVLSGRENIWISGAVLGYSDNEIISKFDDIVRFSELGEFIDAPLQTYSSGMQARLGFSVAINTNPDILLVDEVLAVGDLNFAIKCYRKICEFRESGGCIVLVSHNTYAIRMNCDRAIWIEKGKVQQIGSANDVCDEYDRYVGKKDSVVKIEQECIDESLSLINVKIPEIISFKDNLTIEATFIFHRNIFHPIIGIAIGNMHGQILFSNTFENNISDKIKVGKELKISIKYEQLILSRGVYFVNFVISEKYYNNQLMAIINKYKFEMLSDHLDVPGIIQLSPIWNII